MNRAIEQVRTLSIIWSVDGGCNVLRLQDLVTLLGFGVEIRKSSAKYLLSVPGLTSSLVQ